MQFKFYRIPYYINSMLTLLSAMQFSSVPFFLLTLVPLYPTKIVVLKKPKLTFKLKTFLDLLFLKEVVIDKEYEMYGPTVGYKDKIIVDVGAGFGDFSISIAKKFPHSSVYAFEANKLYFNLLQENIRINNVTNVYPYIKTVRNLHDIFQIIHSPIIDFMKMDCEGYEYSIISNKEKKYIKRIKKLVMEYHEIDMHTASELYAIIKHERFTTAIYPRKEVKGLGLISAVKQ